MRITPQELVDLYESLCDYCQAVVDDFKGDDLNLPLIIVVPAGEEKELRYFRVCFILRKVEDGFDYDIFNIELTNLDEYLDSMNILNQN